MLYNHDHDHYVAKNRALSGGTDLLPRRGPEQKKVEGKREVKPSCFNCKEKRSCSEFKAKRGGRGSGVVSVGGVAEDMICGKYQVATEQNRSMSNKQIKSLMRNFKRPY
jgi:hypothetical protein